jgi:hypothetical protein
MGKLEWFKLVRDTEATGCESVTPEFPAMVALASEALDDFNLYRGITKHI